MSKVEVVVATVKQGDNTLYDKMNVDSDLMIANQSDFFRFDEESIRGNSIKMLTTSTRGVGLNRNLGLQFASGDILMLADDDIIYHQNYEKIIENAFKELPKADVIIFRMQFIKNGEVFEVDKHKTKRLHIWNGLSFGTYQIAVRRKSILKKNIHFTHLFGGGCLYSAGEDSLFLIDCFRKGLRVYSYGMLIGDNVRDSSSWFSGYTEKFFYDRGAFIACAFPKIKHFWLMYYLFVYRNAKNFSNIKKYRLMKAGIEGFETLKTFEEWIMEEGES